MRFILLTAYHSFQSSGGPARRALPPDLSPGMAEGYETVRMLGGGAGGTAFLATRRSDQSQCVIKKVPLKGMSRSEARYAQSELAVMRSLQAHPFIVRFFDSFEAASVQLHPTVSARTAAGAASGSGTDELHLVMEYCSGGTLQDKIDAARDAATVGDDEDGNEPRSDAPGDCLD